MGSIDSNCCGTGKGSKKAKKRMRHQDQFITKVKVANHHSHQVTSNHTSTTSPLMRAGKSISLREDEKTINMDRVSVFHSIQTENDHEILQSMSQQYSLPYEEDDDRTIESDISPLSAESEGCEDETDDEHSPLPKPRLANLLTPTNELDWDPSELFNIQIDMTQELHSLKDIMNKKSNRKSNHNQLQTTALVDPNLFRIRSAGKWDEDDIESNIDAIKGQMVHLIKTNVTARRNSSVSSAATNTSTPGTHTSNTYPDF
eukprot:224487_1